VERTDKKVAVIPDTFQRKKSDLLGDREWLAASASGDREEVAGNTKSRLESSGVKYKPDRKA